MPGYKWMLISMLVIAPGRVFGEGALMKGPRLNIEAYRLPNGLRVALHRDSSLPQVTVCVAYHVGSRNERAGRTGFAHFFEHMMFRGTKNVPDYDVPLQDSGGQSNAFTSEDLTVYHETVSSEYLERVLYMEAERLAFLPTALDQAKFDTEREVVKNERRQSVDNVPYGLVEEALLAHVYPKGHPYSWSVIGSMTDLNAASLDDLKQFFNEFYAPANAALCLAGDFDPAHAKAMISKYFGPLKGGAAAPRQPIRAVTVQPADVELADKVTLPRVHWAWPTVDDEHADAPALDLLAIILAGGETSRLHKALVRDHRLAKDVSADSQTKEIGGLFTIESTAAEGKSIADIEVILAQEIARIKAEPPSDGEMERALARLETSQYAQLTRTLRRAVEISTGFVQKDDPEHYRKEFSRYFSVKPADLKDVAARHLAEGKVRLLVRPLKAGESRSTVTPVGPGTESNQVEARSVGPNVESRVSSSGLDWSRLPGPEELPSFQPPRHERRRLSNGIELSTAKWTTLPLVQLSLRFPAGSGDDPTDKAGLASLTGRLLDQGTAGRTATELLEAFERLGASVHVSVGRDDTSVNLGVLSRNLEPALALMGEMLATPRFDSEDFERERARQLADLLQGRDDVSWIARRAMPIVMFGVDHPYGRPIVGFSRTVKELTQEDVRAFHRDRLVPSGATISAAGDFDSERLFRGLEHALGRLRDTSDGPKARPKSEEAPAPGVIHLVDKPGAVQSVISVGRHWVDRRDENYYTDLVGNHLFGVDFVGRLNKNLRIDHGYSYGAYSHFNFRRSRSVWLASTSVRTEDTVPAIKEIIKEMNEAVGARPITASEVKIATQAEARGFPAEFEAPSGIVAVPDEMAEFQLPADHLDRFLPELQKVELAAVQRRMTELLAPQQRYLLVVGDRESFEPALKKAGFDAIRAITPDGAPVE